MQACEGDILVLPFFGQGHLFPCIELSKHISSHNYKAILIIPSHLSSSIPSSLHHHSLVEVLEIPAQNSPLPPPESQAVPPPPLLDGTKRPEHEPEPEGRGHRPGPGSGFGPRHQHHHPELAKGIGTFLSDRYKEQGKTRPACVVMDVMMSWSKEIFMKAEVPIVCFFTSGACSAAMEYAAWKAHADEMKPGETRILAGLPGDMALSYSDVQRQSRQRLMRGGGRHGPHDPPGGMNSGHPRSDREQFHGGSSKAGPPAGMNFGPPRPGQQPRWLEEVEGSSGLLINTCDDLERVFINYITSETRKPVLGVGPLLPEKYWKSTGSLLRDRDSRPSKESSYTEDEVIHWLDSKPNESVIYVSFGSEVGPTLEEYAQLADALEESNWPFIWVIQPGSGMPGPPPNFFGGQSGSNVKEGGYYPLGLEEKVGDRGLIIKGWAPQLLILSHPSTGGFLSHCGWNSTVEAIGRGIPILAWPIRGDQFYDANLVVKYLKVGHAVLGDDISDKVKKDDILQGIQRLMDDNEVHQQASTLKDIFKDGFPPSSVASLKAFVELIKPVVMP